MRVSETRRGLGLAARHQPAVAGGSVDDPGFTERVQRNRVPTDSRADVVRAYLPYAVIIAVFGLAQIGPIKSALNSVTVKFAWPGLHIVNGAGKAPRRPPSTSTGCSPRARWC